MTVSDAIFHILKDNIPVLPRCSNVKYFKCMCFLLSGSLRNILFFHQYFVIWVENSTRARVTFLSVLLNIIMTCRK